MENQGERQPLLESSKRKSVNDQETSASNFSINVDRILIESYSSNKKLINSRSIKKIFNKPNQGNATTFETILTSNEDNSAVISLILQKFESEHFWTSEMLDNIFISYVNHQATNDKNLLSILMYDWHEWDKNAQRYFLFEKFETVERLTIGKKNMFDLIFEIVMDETKQEYHQICVKIIYYYFHEIMDCVTENGDMQNIVIKALQLPDDDHKNDILKILLAHVIRINKQEYQALKDKILAAVYYETENYHSSLKSSYKSMIKCCDRKFFELVFLLKENSLLQFKVEYKDFIAMHKKYFGEFWTTAMRLQNQILFLLTKHHKLIDIKEFLLIESGDPEIKSIITRFQKIEELLALFIEPLEDRDEKLYTKLLNLMNNKFILNGIINLKDFKNTTEIRRLFFGRKHIEGKSFFEQILSTIQYNDCDFKNTFQQVLNYVWDEFMLKDKPEILTLKNYQGKRLIDHVLNTTCDSLFTSFLNTGKSTYFDD